MNVAWFGLGKLGLPFASLVGEHHQVKGVDPAPGVEDRLRFGHRWEAGMDDYLGRVKLTSVWDALTDADVAVVCVQTPHEPELDGTHATGKRAPFETLHLERCLRQVGYSLPVVVVSTVLPGTCRSLAPLVSELVYAPAFPAMGTVIEDIQNPEFVLVGTSDGSHVLPSRMGDLFDPVVGDAPWFNFTWETAELAKLAYNTMIGMKLAAANTVGWLADSVGADGGQVMEILSAATRRITSAAYMKPGLGDGGPCHPRDLYAMSWLARYHGVYDLYTALIDQREAHSDWIASTALDIQNSMSIHMPIVILGGAYKPESTLDEGSPARLLANQTGWPIVEAIQRPSIIVIGVPHAKYQMMRFPDQSIVIDPWGVVPGALQPGRSQHQVP